MTRTGQPRLSRIPAGCPRRLGSHRRCPQTDQGRRLRSWSLWAGTWPSRTRYNSRSLPSRSPTTFHRPARRRGMRPRFGRDTLLRRCRAASCTWPGRTRRSCRSPVRRSPGAYRRWRCTRGISPPPGRGMLSRNRWMCLRKARLCIRRNTPGRWPCTLLRRRRMQGTFRRCPPPCLRIPFHNRSRAGRRRARTALVARRAEPR